MMQPLQRGEVEGAVVREGDSELLYYILRACSRTLTERCVRYVHDDNDDWKRWHDAF
jgi:hypothetical protein